MSQDQTQGQNQGGAQNMPKPGEPGYDAKRDPNSPQYDPSQDPNKGQGQSPSQR